MVKKHIFLLLLSAIISLPLAAEDEIIINIKGESDTNALTGANNIQTQQYQMIIFSEVVI